MKNEKWMRERKRKNNSKYKKGREKWKIKTVKMIWTSVYDIIISLQDVSISLWFNYQSTGFEYQSTDLEIDSTELFHQGGLKCSSRILDREEDPPLPHPHEYLKKNTIDIINKFNLLFSSPHSLKYLEKCDRNNIMKKNRSNEKKVEITNKFLK